MSGIFFLFFSLRALLWCVFSVHIIIIIGTIVIGFFLYMFVMLLSYDFVLLWRISTWHFFLFFCSYVFMYGVGCVCDKGLNFFKSCDFCVRFDKRKKLKNGNSWWFCDENLIWLVECGMYACVWVDCGGYEMIF